MNRSRLMGIVLSLVFIVGAMMIFVTQSATATENILAKIKSQEIGVEPMTLTIKANDRVVFVNSSNPLSRPFSKPQEVKIVFKEGEKCLAAAESLIGLAMDGNKHLVSDWIGTGQISPVFSKPGVYNYSGQPSAVFTKPGVYIYEVMYKKGGPSARGTIKVEEQ